MTSLKGEKLQQTKTSDLCGAMRKQNEAHRFHICIWVSTRKSWSNMQLAKNPKLTLNKVALV